MDSLSIKQVLSQKDIENDKMIMLEIISENLIEELKLLLQIIDDHKSNMTNLDEYNLKKRCIKSLAKITELKDIKKVFGIWNILKIFKQYL